MVFLCAQHLSNTALAIIKKMCRGFLLPQLVKYIGDISFLVEQWLPLRQMHLSLGALCIMTGAYCST